MTDTVPHRHFALVAHLAKARGIDTPAVREQLDLTSEIAVDLEARVPAARYRALLLAIDRASSDPNLWFDVGQQLTPVSMGHFGQLIMTCANLRHAIRCLCRYYPLVRSATEVHWEEADDAVLYVRTQCPPGREARLYIEGTMGALQRSFQVLCGLPASHLAFDFDYSAPANADAYRRCLGGRVAFDRPACRVRIPRAFLDVPFAHANARMNALLVAQCEADMAALRRPRAIVEEVTDRITRSRRLTATLELVARELAMSPRTLSRRLSESGTRFDSVRQRVRRERAAALLATTDLPVASVANQVGFDDASNFARAFQRWTGRSPSRFRRETQDRPATPELTAPELTAATPHQGREHAPSLPAAPRVGLDPSSPSS